MRSSIVHVKGDWLSRLSKYQSAEVCGKTGSYGDLGQHSDREWPKPDGPLAGYWDWKGTRRGYLMNRPAMSLLVVAAALLAILLAGCSDETAPTPTATSTPEPTVYADRHPDVDARAHGNVDTGTHVYADRHPDVDARAHGRAYTHSRPSAERVRIRTVYSRFPLRNS